ncbi:MAG TPA: DUF6503 family protein [Longibacter sp.]
MRTILNHLPIDLRLLALLVLGIVLAGCPSADSSDPGASVDTTASDEASTSEAALKAGILGDANERADAARSRLEQSAGGRLLLETIAAHGGLVAWYEAPTSSYTWEYANRDVDLQFKSFLVANNRTRTAYHDLLSIGPFGAPEPIDGAFAWNGNVAWITPDSLEQPNPHFWATTGYYFEQIPFVLADPGVTLEILQDETLDGQTYQMLRAGYDEGTGYSDDDTYTLYIHPRTRRVEAIRYTVTYGQDLPDDADVSETLFYYEDYVTVDGLTVPRHFRGYRFKDGEKGERRSEAWADSISFRRPFEASQLTPPSDARVMTPPPIERATK